MGNNMEVTQKLIMKLSYDPAISLVGIYPKDLKIGSQRTICTRLLIASLFTRAKRWKQAECP